MPPLPRDLIKRLLRVAPAACRDPLGRIACRAGVGLRLLAAGKRPIVVYQMGKVGSRTVVALLRRYSRKPVFHVHVLAAGRLAGSHYARRNRREGLACLDWTPRHLRRELTIPSLGRRWRIVAPVRDPIARDVSAFFQNADLPEMAEPLASGDLAALQRIFDAEAVRHPAVSWFDEEFRPVTGVDVYTLPFDPFAGYALNAVGAYDLLLIRTERLDELWPRAARALFCRGPRAGAGSGVLNAGADRPYGTVYRRFLAGMTLPSGYYDRVLASRYLAHFFTPAEVAAFRERWGPRVVRA